MAKILDVTRPQVTNRIGRSGKRERALSRALAGAHSFLPPCAGWSGCGEALPRAVGRFCTWIQGHLYPMH